MSDPTLAYRPAVRRTGAERFHAGGQPLDVDLLDFWQWSASDMVSNVTRGRLAEYIVARAIGAPTDGVRNDWAPYDLLTADGVKVEVKSAAYLQSWHQEKVSPIGFRTRATKGWDVETATETAERRRQADVYVFALLAPTDKERLDPLDVTQWEFYVLARAVLDARERSQHSITLSSLRALCSDGPHAFEQLGAKVRAMVGLTER